MHGEWEEKKRRCSVHHHQQVQRCTKKDRIFFRWWEKTIHLNWSLFAVDTNRQRRRNVVPHWIVLFSCLVPTNTGACVFVRVWISLIRSLIENELFQDTRDSFEMCLISTQRRLYKYANTIKLPSSKKHNQRIQRAQRIPPREHQWSDVPGSRCV